MELDLATLFYMFFRLAPFILVSYFTLASVINQDIKGVIYLVGVIVACFVCIIVGGVFFNTPSGDVTSLTSEQCETFTISQQPISKLPLSIAVLTYTTVYLFFVIFKYKIWSSNIPTLILFPVLIICDFMWNTSYKCFGYGACFTAFGIAGGIGYIWALIINGMGNPDLQYFNVGSNQQVCSRPSKQLFKCSFGTTSANSPTSEQSAIDKLGTVMTDITNQNNSKAKTDIVPANTAVDALN